MTDDQRKWFHEAYTAAPPVEWPSEFAISERAAEGYRAIDDALYHEDGDMACPAAGGIPCGADDCLRNGCIEERGDG